MFIELYCAHAGTIEIVMRKALHSEEQVLYVLHLKGKLINYQYIHVFVACALWTSAFIIGYLLSVVKTLVLGLLVSCDNVAIPDFWKISILLGCKIKEGYIRAARSFPCNVLPELCLHRLWPISKCNEALNSAIYRKSGWQKHNYSNSKYSIMNLLYIIMS